MCKVAVNSFSNDVDFIIYNHLFSKENYRFTINQLVEELRQYDLHLTHEVVQMEVNGLIRSGLVNQSLRSYTVCGR